MATNGADTPNARGTTPTNRGMAAMFADQLDGAAGMPTPSQLFQFGGHGSTSPARSVDPSNKRGLSPRNVVSSTKENSQIASSFGPRLRRQHCRNTSRPAMTTSFSPRPFAETIHLPAQSLRMYSTSKPSRRFLQKYANKTVLLRLDWCPKPCS